MQELVICGHKKPEKKNHHGFDLRTLTIALKVKATVKDSHVTVENLLLNFLGSFLSLLCDKFTSRNGTSFRMKKTASGMDINSQ